MKGKQNGLSRRGFLKGAAATGGGLALAGFVELFGLRDAYANHDRKDDPVTIASLASTAETLAATSYYYTILNNPFGFSNVFLNYLKLAMTSELYHKAVVESLGGKPLATRFYVPEKFLTSKEVNTATFLAAETAFTAAYLAATRRFAELGQPRLAATTAQHAATEAEHLALSRIVGGAQPANPNALPAPIYYNVSDAVPTLAPFLQGGAGFIGPVEFPGADAINKLAGDLQAFKVPTFTQVF
jgi:hypothetical protein